MENDFEIYDGKSFSELCKDVVDNQEEMKEQIDNLVAQLKPLIKTVNDAMVVVPMIKDYIDVSVKNNEHLIKLATITNKIRSKYSDSDALDSGEFDGVITEKEKSQIIEALKDFHHSTPIHVEKLTNK